MERLSNKNNHNFLTHFESVYMSAECNISYIPYRRGRKLNLLKNKRDFESKKKILFYPMIGCHARIELKFLISPGLFLWYQNQEQFNEYVIFKMSWYPRVVFQ